MHHVDCDCSWYRRQNVKEWRALLYAVIEFIKICECTILGIKFSSWVDDVVCFVAINALEQKKGKL